MMRPYLAYTPRRTCHTVARGLLAVAVLVAGALDALVTAAIGVPPVAWTTRRLARLVRDAYRIGRYGPPSTCTDLAVVVPDGEVIDDEETPR